jgi:uncharacterized membrane protein
MTVPADARPVSSTRAVERLINFSDAVVAVAVTLLALPLVDIRPAAGESVGQAIGENIGSIIAFLFTFLVVALMWSAHNRILNGIRDFDGALFWLNTIWLALVVLLPWVSAMFGESQMVGNGAEWPGVGTLYWGTLGLISLVGWFMSWHLSRHPELLDDEEAATRTLGSARRGLIFGAYFILIGLVSVIAPDVASWLPLGIIPLSIWLRPARGSLPPHAARPTKEHA